MPSIGVLRALTIVARTPAVLGMEVRAATAEAKRSPSTAMPEEALRVALAVHQVSERARHRRFDFIGNDKEVEGEKEREEQRGGSLFYPGCRAAKCDPARPFHLAYVADCRHRLLYSPS